MNKVYVVQDPRGKNILPAKQYGELEVILTGHESPCQAFGKLRHKLKGFDHTDYLLLIGDPLFIGMAVHTVLEAAIDQMCNLNDVKFLTWNPNKYEYRIERLTDNERNKQADATTRQQ